MKKYALSTIVLAIILSLTSGSAQQTSEAQKSTTERRWNFVITNDNISSLIKKADVYDGGVAIPAVPATERTPANPPIPSSRLAKHFVMRIDGICNDSASRVITAAFKVPFWCPDPGSEAFRGVYGGIQVNVGDEVEIELVNLFNWSGAIWRENDPIANFTLFRLNWNAEDLRDAKRLSKLWEARNLSADDLVTAHRLESKKGIADPNEAPAFSVSTRVLHGQTVLVRFTADKAGLFQYRDPLHTSGFGLFIVNP